MAQQVEVRNCSQHLDDVVSDMFTVKNQSLRMSSLADASVKNCPAKSQPTLCQWQRLRYTMHDGMTERPLSSPNDAPISGGLEHIFMGKCPLKLQFPTFGKKEDSSYLLLYLEKCKDFLSLNPLANSELMVILILYGYSQGLVGCHSWKYTFLDRLVQIPLPVRGLWGWAGRKIVNTCTRRGWEYQELRLDVPFFVLPLEAGHYRGKCRESHPWNIVTQMVSQLWSRVSTVEGLVRLAQELEKDEMGQTHYDYRKKHQHNPALLLRYVAGGVKEAIILMHVQILTSRRNTDLPPQHKGNHISHGGLKQVNPDALGPTEGQATTSPSFQTFLLMDMPPLPLAI